MRPANEQELSEAIASATAPLDIRGGNTRRIGQVEGDVLETCALSGITLYEPAALTLVVRAGTPLAEVEATLAAEGQRLPFEPMDCRLLQGTTGTPTIGGMVATNSSGPRRIQAGACRDSLIGVRFVDGSGNIIKNGGRVMKNVTGYDLVKLMAGSHGTLGVISEVAFKVQPIPEASATVLVENGTDTAAVACMAAALGSPFDVNGVAHSDGVTAIRVEGLEGSVNYRAAALAAQLGGAVEAFDWAALRDVQAFADKAGDVWRFSVRPSDGPALADALRGLGADAVVHDWAGGLIWVLASEGADLRGALAGMGGHGTLVRASGTLIPAFQPEAAPIMYLNKGLRAKFDPRGILNAGRMG